jgi:hypothetical protein
MPRRAASWSLVWAALAAIASTERSLSSALGPGQLADVQAQARRGLGRLAQLLGHEGVEQRVQLGGLAARRASARDGAECGEAGGDGGQQHLTAILQGETPKERFVGRMRRPCPAQPKINFY